MRSGPLPGRACWSASHRTGGRPGRAGSGTPATAEPLGTGPPEEEDVEVLVDRLPIVSIRAVAPEPGHPGLELLVGDEPERRDRPHTDAVGVLPETARERTVHGGPALEIEEPATHRLDEIDAAGHARPVDPERGGEEPDPEIGLQGLPGRRAEQHEAVGCEDTPELAERGLLVGDVVIHHGREDGVDGATLERERLRRGADEPHAIGPRRLAEHVRRGVDGTDRGREHVAKETREPPGAAADIEDTTERARTQVLADRARPGLARLLREPARGDVPLVDAAAVVAERHRCPRSAQCHTTRAETSGGRQCYRAPRSSMIATTLGARTSARRR